MGETTEQSKARDVHEEPVDLISENPDEIIVYSTTNCTYHQLLWIWNRPCQL